MRRGKADVPLVVVAPVLPDPMPMGAISTREHMGRADAVRIAEDLFRQHGLNGWHVHFDNARRRAGACAYNRKQIRLSAPLMAQRSWADTHMTITHEIAHALTPGHQHDHVWAAQHRALGGNGTRCFDHFDDDAPWVGTCGHGKKFAKYRRPKRLEGWRCKCVRGGAPIVWVENIGQY